MRKNAKYIYPVLEKAIVRCGKPRNYIANVLDMTVVSLSNKRYGVSDWRLGEMLAIRKLLAPDMTLDELFRREEVRPDGTV